MKKYSNQELAVIDKLQLKYGVTRHYVVKCIKGENASETGETIAKEYKTLTKKVANVLS